jgi:hypothetical protein
LIDGESRGDAGKYGWDAGIRTLLFTSEELFPLGAELAFEFVMLLDLFTLFCGGIGVSKGSKVLKKTGLAGLSMGRGMIGN